MDIIAELADKECPAATRIDYNSNVLTITSSRSLFRLKTYLDGVVDMYNSIYDTYRIIWLKVSRNRLILEEIRV